MSTGPLPLRGREKEKRINKEWEGVGRETRYMSESFKRMTAKVGK